MHNDAARAWIEIDLAALRWNASALAAQAGVPLLPMVKADAYGLGALRVVAELRSVRVWGFGVAISEEGIQLRRSGMGGRIVVFTPPLRHELPALREFRLTPALGSAGLIDAWRAGGNEPWHLAVDTGMSRAGVRWDGVDSLAERVSLHPPEGAFTHFHSSERADGSKELQEERFRHAMGRLPMRPELLHTENSGAIARRTHSEWDLVRPGLFLYGVGSGADALIQPRPVAYLRARVVELREIQAGESVSYNATYTARAKRTIATVPVGYADGYRRALSNCGGGVVNGRCVPVAGIVTMDMTMFDVTDVPCSVGDTVTLIGGEEEGGQSAGTAAAAAKISPYELLTGLRSRLPRVYTNGGG